MDSSYSNLIEESDDQSALRPILQATSAKTGEEFHVYLQALKLKAPNLSPHPDEIISLLLDRGPP